MRVITYTARILDIGDSYIAADNQRYEVVDIQGDTIKVEAREKSLTRSESAYCRSEAKYLGETCAAGTTQKNDDEGREWNTIGITHTHNLNRMCLLWGGFRN